MIIKIITGLVLALLAVQDIREQQIDVVIPVIAGVILFAIQFHAESASIGTMMGGAAVGGMLILIGFLRPGMLGAGDGVTFIMTGIASGFWGNLSLLWISSVMAGIYAVALQLWKHREKTYEFAFLPFVLGGYIICCICKS